MFLIYHTKGFEKSYKRIKESGELKGKAKSSLEEAIDLLAIGSKLDKSFKDHSLTGELKEYRECHIKGNLLLVYQVRHKELILILVDLGSHSYLRI